MGSKPRSNRRTSKRWTGESDEFFESLQAGEFDRFEHVIERADELLRRVPTTMRKVRKRLEAVSIEYGEALRRFHMGDDLVFTSRPESKPNLEPRPKPSPTRLTKPLGSVTSTEPGSISVLASDPTERYVAVRENFVVTLFFRHKLNKALAKGATKLFGEWLDLIGEDSLSLAMIGSNATSTRPVTPQLLKHARSRFTSDATAGVKSHYMRLYGPQECCPDYAFSSTIDVPEDCQMDWGRYFTTNVIELHFPVSFFHQQGSELMVQIIAKLASHLPYDSGIAGWALHDIDSGDSRSDFDSRKIAGELALRYPGYFLSDGGSYSSHTMGDRSQGAQWLSLVGPKLLKELGGVDELGPEILVHKSGKGVLVQAGPCPLVGRENEDLTPYRKVAEWLCPVSALDSSSPQNYMSIKDAQTWTLRYLG